MADTTPQRTQLFDASTPDCLAPLRLDSGAELSALTIAYQTWGTLNAERSNAILICHALSGDAHAAGIHQEDGRKGWWDGLIGPGLAFDTDRYFIICTNALGGCRGSTGPASLDPATGKPYARDFPVITIWDMVRAQERLLNSLGIERLLAVAGGSMGGMQALAWARLFPERLCAAIPMATSARHSAQSIAWNEIGRRAIMADPHWNGGDYYGEGQPRPVDGLAVARMIGHVTYLSEEAMERKFGRELRERDAVSYSFDVDFQVESYLTYQGRIFHQRFDANSYLYITRALDYFDFARDVADDVAAFAETRARYLFLSFSSDWLYPPTQNASLAEAARHAGRDVIYHEIPTSHGHDAFLVDTEESTRHIREFLANL